MHQRKSFNINNQSTGNHQPQAQNINPSTSGPRMHNRFSTNSTNYQAHPTNGSTSGPFGASNGGISHKLFSSNASGSVSNSNNVTNSRSKENVHHPHGHQDFTKLNKQKSVLYGASSHQAHSLLNSGVPEPITTVTGKSGAPIKNSQEISGSAAISARSYGATNTATSNSNVHLNNGAQLTNGFQQTQPLQEVALYEIENRGQFQGTSDVAMEATQLSLGAKRPQTYLPRKASHEKFASCHQSVVNSTKNRPATAALRATQSGSTKIQSNSMGHRSSMNAINSTSGNLIQSKLQMKKTQQHGHQQQSALNHNSLQPMLDKRSQPLNNNASQQSSLSSSIVQQQVMCAPAIISSSTTNGDMHQQKLQQQQSMLDQSMNTTNTTIATSPMNPFCQISKDCLQISKKNHPSLHLDRKVTNDVDRQNINVNCEYGLAIDKYMRQLEEQTLTTDCLFRHKVTPALRARMIDWMIEVLTNFKCDDQTFFLAVALLDRYFKGKQESREISDLHIIGVTVMFIASKYEDIYPLKMKMVFEKIAHKKLPIERIKTLELEILKTINYKIAMPTALDFLKVYLKQVLNIGHAGKTSIKKEKKDEPVPSSDTPEGLNILIQKMSMYLGKMAMHDYDLSGKKPSLLAVGSLYVALKICEQLKKTTLISNDIVKKLVSLSASQEEEIIVVSQRVLYLAQNFDKTFPGLENLKKTHFVNITQLL